MRPSDASEAWTARSIGPTSMNVRRASKEACDYLRGTGKIPATNICKISASYPQTTCELSANCLQTSCKRSADCLQNICPKLSAESLRVVCRAATLCAAARCPQLSKPPKQPECPRTPPKNISTRLQKSAKTSAGVYQRHLGKYLRNIRAQSIYPPLRRRRPVVRCERQARVEHGPDATDLAPATHRSASRIFTLFYLEHATAAVEVSRQSERPRRDPSKFERSGRRRPNRPRCQACLRGAYFFFERRDCSGAPGSVLLLVFIHFRRS